MGKRHSKELLRYDEHKGNARRRGIPFLLTPNEWIGWWVKHLGKEWMKKRGCTKGKYCMARKSDEGPYALWNVECITHSRNAVDEWQNNKRKGVNHNWPKGERHPKTHLTEEQVRTIFLSEAPPTQLARSYGIKYRTLYDIQTGKTWRHATKDLIR